MMPDPAEAVASAAETVSSVAPFHDASDDPLGITSTNTRHPCLRETFGEARVCPSGVSPGCCTAHSVCARIFDDVVVLCGTMLQFPNACGHVASGVGVCSRCSGIPFRQDGEWRAKSLTPFFCVQSSLGSEDEEIPRQVMEPRWAMREGSEAAAHALSQPFTVPLVKDGKEVPGDIAPLGEYAPLTPVYNNPLAQFIPNVTWHANGDVCLWLGRQASRRGHASCDRRRRGKEGGCDGSGALGGADASQNCHMIL